MVQLACSRYGDRASGSVLHGRHTGAHLWNRSALSAIHHGRGSDQMQDIAAPREGPSRTRLTARYLGLSRSKSRNVIPSQRVFSRR